MSDKIDSIYPDLTQAFAVVLDWLNFDTQLTDREMKLLKSSFMMAAKNDDVFMSVSSSTQAVLVSDRKALSLEIPKGAQYWFQNVAVGHAGLHVKRAGFFLFQTCLDESPNNTESRRVAVAPCFFGAEPGKTMILG